MKTQKMVLSLKNHEQDFEWYPTTKEIINAIKLDYSIKNDSDESPSILDCGAGDGRVLVALTSGEKYAIEKSRPLLNSLDKDIFVIGTDFKEQTLIDKKVDIVFSNPPYSEFEYWASKIIKEANAGYIYLVLPERWKKSTEINDFIKLRDGEHKIIGSFDFNNAERQARAKVDIVRICLTFNHRYSHCNEPKIDPFKVWFDDNFKIDINKSDTSKYDYERMKKSSVTNRIENELVSGISLVDALEELYLRDIKKLINTYQKLCEIDSEILKELDVNLDSVRNGLQHKIENLKDNYWRELFERLNVVTDKLTASSREALLSTLTAHTHVDFTSSNAHAIIIWVIKNANLYLDSQLIKTVENMVEKANVLSYKSNENTFGNEDWRYCRMPDIKRYKLDYRIVLERVGGLDCGSYSYDAINGLSKRAAIFVNDLCTIATNLNYNTYGLKRADSFDWKSTGSKDFEFKDAEGNINILFSVRAYKNGNLHIKFNAKFICKLNVEFGRLKGWLKSSHEAAEELNIPVSETEIYFYSNFQLKNNSLLKLGFDDERQQNKKSN